ncbi:MAG: alpha-hydroxy acid oxidase [Paracoccaceae bacterium]|nr:alpha-hydroxy acid oxidase [Paracoccaceae bacterium]
MTDLTRLTTISDLRNLARRRVPKMFYDYVDSGSWSESTLRANTSDFESIKFRQRVAVDISNRNTSVDIFGVSSKMPCAIAPVGLLGMQHADGEIIASKVAEDFGIPFTLSTMSICSIEDVARHARVPFWFQLYVMKDHSFSRKLIDRAKAAGCSALMLTVDLQILGQRHKDIKNGLSTPPRLTVKNILNLMEHPKWCLNMLKTPRKSFRNIVGHVDGISDISKLSAWVSEQFDPKLSWGDVARIRDWWGGKFIIKGIMEPEDASEAIKIGADAIVVSNHGGRQLDETTSSISMLPSIVSEVGGKVSVWMDGGIRSGQDILKAIALGAENTLVGRSFCYGIGAHGTEGGKKALNILHQELDMTMALCGHRDIRKVDRSILKF